MAIINIKPSWSTPTLSRGRQSRAAGRAFTVLCDTPGDEQNLFDIDQHPGIPQRGQAHPLSGWLVVDDVTIKPLGPCLYEVVATYTTVGGSKDDASSSSDDPTTIRSLMRWSWAESQEAVDCDINGRPLTNTVGEGFDPPVQWTVMDAVLTITRSTTAYHGGLLRAASGSLNAVDFMGAKRGQARLTATCDEAWNGNTQYWEETFTISFREGLPVTKGKYGETYGGPERAWFLRVLNQGFRVWTGDTDAQGNPWYKELVDAEGKPLTKPVLLDSKGYQLKPGEPPHWLEFQMNFFLNWDVLDLEGRSDLMLSSASSSSSAVSQTGRARASTQRDRAWTQRDSLRQISLTPRSF